MYTRITIVFKNEEPSPLPWGPSSHVFKTNQPVRIQECILEHTGNHDLAMAVSNWADIAGFGEQYDCDELNALILDD